MSSPHLPIRTFDPADELHIVERRDLPHWMQAGTIAFITWRTWDSIPAPVMARWLTARADWLQRHGIDPHDKEWRSRVAALQINAQHSFRQLVAERWEQCLDDCHGECVLRRPELSGIVADSFHHFDGKRYVLTDFVVMPNHVHLLAAFQSPESMLAQCDSWKHYTAVQINCRLNRDGRFWQVDGFDHLVRSDEQFEYFREYIAQNPRKAALQPHEFRHYSGAINL